MVQRYSAGYFITSLPVAVLGRDARVQTPDVDMACAFVSSATLQRLNDEIYRAEETDREFEVLNLPLVVRVQNQTMAVFESEAIENNWLYVPPGLSDIVKRGEKPQSVLIAKRERAKQLANALT